MHTMTTPSPAVTATPTILATASEATPPTLSSADEQRVLELLRHRHARSTVVNYENDWRRFESWCAHHTHVALPAHPNTVAAYLAEHAELRRPDGDRAYSANTLARWSATINYFHRTAGKNAPGDHQVVKDTLSGIRRGYATRGERPTQRVAPLTVDEIIHIIVRLDAQADSWERRVRARRDIALLLLGFVGAFRRSELSHLAIGDVTRHADDGLHMRVRRSKTDQTGRGQVKAAPYTLAHTTCPPCAWRRWRDVVSAFDTEGRPGVLRLLHTPGPFTRHVCRDPLPPHPDEQLPLFRPIRRGGGLASTALSGPAIHAAIRRAAAAADIDPGKLAHIGGHSLRAGFVTQAFRNGASAHEIMRQTGHANPATLESYAREHSPLTGNAANSIGL